MKCHMKAVMKTLMKCFGGLFMYEDVKKIKEGGAFPECCSSHLALLRHLSFTVLATVIANKWLSPVKKPAIHVSRQAPLSCM